MKTFQINLVLRKIYILYQRRLKVLMNVMKLTFIYLFFFLDYETIGTASHSWPIVPASGDNEDDCGEHDGM
jgi:hypothetical protein